jgi:hypothetical protein
VFRDGKLLIAIGIAIWLLGFTWERATSAADVWPTGETVIVFVAGLIPTVLGVMRLQPAKRAQRRGFEVKTNAGEEPVIKKEREHDHG